MNSLPDLKGRMAYKAWKRVGIKHHHGVNVPLFSLHTKKSCGVGEYLDLLPLIDWCSSLGMDVIQLLPLNESGSDPSPYNALSSCALHPIYLSLHALPHLNIKSKPFKTKQFNRAKRLNYHAVYREKLKFLYDYVQKTREKLKKGSEYEAFVTKHQWLPTYALFRTLKDLYCHIHWKHWPKQMRFPTKLTLKTLYVKHAEEMEKHLLIQYLCFMQLQKVKSYATSKGVYLKGDIPILVSPDSADVWAHTPFFDFTYVAGSPPSQSQPKGQYWGFPLYQWHAIEEDHFSWWKQRLQTAEELYHIYRIDHVIGFFRLWAIPLGQTSKNGIFIPKDPSLMQIQGRKILEYLLTFSQMLPIAETLGEIPLFASTLLSKLAIPGTKVLRWERDWKKDEQFIPIKDYNPISMSSVSTHDTDTVTLWWQKEREEARAYAAFKGWVYQKELSCEHTLDILRDCHHSGSLFHINLFQEYLALIPELTWEDPEDERINYPGTIHPFNWSYRYKLPLEKLLSHPKLYAKMEEVLNNS